MSESQPHLPVLSSEELRASYYGRYQNTQPEATESLRAQYPDFPGVEEAYHRLQTETQTELVTMLPLKQYDRDPNLPFPYRWDKIIPSSELRHLYQGTDEQLEAHLYDPSERGVQLTDPQFDVPEQLRTEWLADARAAQLERLAGLTSHNMWWHNGNVAVNKDIAEGRLSQVFDLHMGDNVMQLVNCDRPMNDEEVKEIRSVVSQLATASDGKIFDRLQTIVVQHNDRFNPVKRDDGALVVGHAHPELGVFRLNSVIRDLASLMPAEDPVSPNVPGWSSLQNTLAHELAHLLDIDGDTDPRLQKINDLATQNPAPEADNEYSENTHSVFLRPLGWHSKRLEANDKDGKPTAHVVRGIRGVSDEMYVVDESGVEHKVQANRHFTADELAESLPLTPYGYIKPREDFAEAFKSYALAGPESVERVRREIIRHTIATLVTRHHIAYTPDMPVTVTEKPLKELQLTYSVPTYGPVAVFVSGTHGWKEAKPWMMAIGGLSEGYYAPKDN